MPKDVYNFNAVYKNIGLVQSKEMMLTIADNKIAAEYLLQNVSFSYQQPVQVVREIGSSNGYYLAYPPIGNLTASRIIGKRPITDYLGTPGQGIFTVPSNGGSSEGTGRLAILSPIMGVKGPIYRMHGCIVMNISFNGDANRFIVQEDVQIKFGMLEVGKQ